MPGTSRYLKKEYATIFVLTNTFLFCLMDDVINFQLFLFFSWVKYFDSEIIAHIRFLKGKAYCKEFSRRAHCRIGPVAQDYFFLGKVPL